MSDPPDTRPRVWSAAPSQERVDDAVWSELRELRSRVANLEMRHAQSRVTSKEEAMAVKEAIAEHLRQVELVSYEVRKVLEKIEAQDQREKERDTEREIVRSEISAEQESVRRRTQEEFDRIAENTGKVLSVREKQASISDARIDGPHRRRLAVLTLLMTVVGGLLSLAASSALSHCR